ncbi:MAG: acyltransferase [Acetobacteraceae bacterium]
MRAPIPGLTGLRFFAAAGVVLSHAIPTIIKSPDPPLWLQVLSQTAAEGMPLFFVLSGFVIFYNYSGSVSRPVGLYNFFIARFSRLYPLYFVGVSYDLLMKFAYSQVPETFAALPYYATMTQSWFYVPIGQHALIYQYGLVPSVAWSISTEWFFYLAFPFICRAILLLRSLRATLLAILGLVVAAYVGFVMLNLNNAVIESLAVRAFGPIAANQQDSFFRWLMYFSPYARIVEFTLGCLCAALHMRLAPIAVSSAERRFGLGLTIAALAGIATMHYVMFGLQSGALWHRILIGLHLNFAFAPLLATLIFCCARYRNAIVRVFAHPLLVTFGEASYSLYLLHLLPVFAYRWEAPPVTSPRVAVGGVLQLILTLMSAIGLSLVSHALIEVPAQRLLRRLMIRKRTEPAAAAPALAQADAQGAAPTAAG